MAQSVRPPIEKFVVVTRPTELEGLIQQFQTKDQARFYIEHMGASFGEYEAKHRARQVGLDHLKEALEAVRQTGVKVQYIDRDFLPNFTFGPRDCAITLGPDGLVVNVAKYLDGQPLLAFNPDPARIDGVLVPFSEHQAPDLLRKVLSGSYYTRDVTMAKAELNDGQSIYAVNDLFIGRKTHVSARYELIINQKREHQSSSGVIVSTGAGSTGWLKSLVTGAMGIAAQYGTEEQDAPKRDPRFAWEDGSLVYCVREPFISKISTAQMICGTIHAGEVLEIVSQMPLDGVIFSDGIEADFLNFNSGAIATIGVAEKKLYLVTA